MHGPTMTMPSAHTDARNIFHRSQSSSNIPSIHKSDSKLLLNTSRLDELPRSASYTHLPVTENPSYATEKKAAQGSTSSRPPVTSRPSISRQNSRSSYTAEVTSNGHPAEGKLQLERVGRTKSLVSRPISWMKNLGGSPERRALRAEKSQVAPPVPLPTKPSQEKIRTGSFASFARKSWMPSSRSPSPSNKAKKDVDESTLEDDDSTTASSTSSSSPRKTMATLAKPDHPLSISITATNLPPSAPRRNTLLQKLRPTSELLTATDLKSAGTSTTSLSQSSASTPRRSVEIPPVPKMLVKERTGGMGLSSLKRDELWAAFRALDTDHQKFMSKSSALRTNVVRSTLLPFLRNHTQHPSNKNIRPQDLERRVTVLNKWWLGLLEMLDGHNNQYISGIDRPVLLDAIAGIMARPEWRQSPSNFAPLADRQPMSRSQSIGSLDSSTAEFLADSVYHNTRNIFIQNLMRQMSIVVEKMSMRNAPASLVAFCGKAVAYAFFFCPGIADVLVKIWGIPAETLRRITEKFGMIRRPRNSRVVDEILIEFPPNLFGLGWTSTKTIIAQLRQKTILPPGAARIHWHGPWVSRWCGRDSDLFFIFVKHYHILLEEFLPLSATFLEKTRAPGFVMVHSQLLTALDSTIHRQPSGDAAIGPISVTFDDILSGADASAAALPLPPSSNVARLMSENRLIMLIRDFLSDRPVDFEQARLTFAGAFSHVIKCAAERTSQFDHNACFILCDFMEEALGIILKFQHSHVVDFEIIDWEFWLKVCCKMLESQNSMTEIRLFSFIFGGWNLITSIEERKKALCLDWLLSEDTFQTYFLHWCPMVRAYFMRLLCWRICRHDGEASYLDTKVLSTVSERLKSIWSQYLYLKQAAEEEHNIPPSTAPCHPAPGRRLMIIRNDTQAVAASILMGFDGMFPAIKSGNSPNKSNPAPGIVVHPEGLEKAPVTEPAKKRWSLRGRMSSFGSAEASSNGQSTSPPLSKDPTAALEAARQATAISRARSSSVSSVSSMSSVSSARRHRASSSVDSDRGTIYGPPPPKHRIYAFKFSLEWSAMPAMNSHFLHSPAMSSSHAPLSSSNRPNPTHYHSTNQGPGRERILSPPRLPMPCIVWLVSQSQGLMQNLEPKKPERRWEVDMRYSGRALAEWGLIVSECDHFGERRRAEGVPDLRGIEVPSLGVEGFRKFC